MENPYLGVQTDSSGPPSSGSTLINLLKLVAVLNFIGGLVAAFSVWASAAATPMGLVLAAAFFAEAVVVTTVLLVIAEIAEDIKAIRANTQPLSQDIRPPPQDDDLASS